MYIILGLGEQGTAILKYLINHTNETVYTFDPAIDVKSHLDRWIHIQQPAALEMLEFNIPPQDIVVISTLPTRFNKEEAVMCMVRGFNWIDLGGDTEVARQIELAWKKGIERPPITILPDCGVAPGLVSSMAAHGAELGYEDIYIYCGGLPVKPKLPLGYARSFSTEGLLKEYSGLCEEVVEGELVEYPALSGDEQIFFPGLGVLEARRTSGGISTAADLLLSTSNLYYKTLRYPGHWDYVEDFIVRHPDAIKRLETLCDEVSPKNPDLLVIQLELCSHEDGDENKLYRWRWDYDHHNQISAMAQATGYTVAAVATMVHEKLLPQGFVHMHNVDFTELARRIKKCPDQFRRVE